MWNLDSPNMWKTIQGLNGTPDINSSNKTMSHDGQTITSIKSKVNVFIHHYARVVNLPCLHVDWDLNRQFKKRQNARSVLHFKWVSYYLPSKRSSAKEQLALTTFYLHFSSHLVLWPSRTYYPYSTHSFHLLIVQVSGGSRQSFHYWKLGNLPVKLHLSASSAEILSSNFWNTFLLILFTTLSNQKPIQLIPSQFLLRSKLLGSQQLESTSNRRWFPTTLNATLRTLLDFS